MTLNSRYHRVTQVECAAFFQPLLFLDFELHEVSQRMSLLLGNDAMSESWIPGVGQQDLSMLMYLRNKVEIDATILVHRLVLITSSPHRSLLCARELALWGFFQAGAPRQIQLAAFGLDELIILFIKHKPKAIKGIECPLRFLHSLLFPLPAFLFVILKMAIGTSRKVFGVSNFTNASYISLWTEIRRPLALSILHFFGSPLPFILSREETEEPTVIEVDFFNQLRL